LSPPEDASHNTVEVKSSLFALGILTYDGIDYSFVKVGIEGKNMTGKSASGKNLIHWSDKMAEKIIRKYGDKEVYTLASGITPSGVVHFGNFRETITVDLVARALKDRGKKVRFIFSWDDYDTFRKVPKNMPNPEELEKYLFQPIVDTPDPFGKNDSYAAYHEKNYENQLHRVDIFPEPLYQAKKYRAGEYKDGILKALREKETITQVLNKHRKEPLAPDWLPVSIYCEKMQYGQNGLDQMG